MDSCIQSVPKKFAFIEQTKKHQYETSRKIEELETRIEFLEKKLEQLLTEPD